MVNHTNIMGQKAFYKEQKRVVMSAFNAKFPLHNSISQAYDKATDRQQMLMFLCASMPAEKVETALHVMGNLIKGDNIVQVNDDVYNELDRLTKETLKQEVGELFQSICRERNFINANDLKAFFDGGIDYSLSNDKTVCFQTRGDEIVVSSAINKDEIIETFSTIF